MVNRFFKKIDAIDYTHLLGYPSEVVAVEIITMVKDIIGSEVNMKETNMEHFRGEAEEKKYDFGKRKDSSTGKEHLISCVGVSCRRCDFYTGNNMDDDLFNCSARKIKWLMSEYKPEPVLTAREKHFVEFVQEGWIARDANNGVFWHGAEPKKCDQSWGNDCLKYARVDSYDREIFPFITWEDEEPWSVEDLRKLKVQDEV